MTTYISMLRGINLGSHNKIKMEDLRNMLTGMHYQKVQTYIQSGNIVFQHPEADTKDLSAAIHQEMQQHFGLDVPVLTLPVAELKKVAAQNPYIKDVQKDPTYFHVTFLEDAPSPENIAKIDPVKYLPDEWVVVDKAVYLYCPNGYGNTKLHNSFLENKLKVTATTRNWKTTHVLIDMAEKL